ncbi:hypothetical protein MLD38_036481 [Melastoma candidum]|uniref:Uncharacterized protein n=1 Tax=Melastoma candidum TaxID=119954 RepID=A0ACB9LJ62_9MYRT|nr:hypothetical protein MLD38_036481 [Melastoma candidum]
MACKGFFECLLKLLNFLLTLAGLAMIGYGIYLFIEYEKSSSGTVKVSPTNGGGDVIKLGRPMLLAVSLSSSFLDDIPTAWFIVVYIAVGVVLFVISLFGCIGGCTRNGCCLTFYAFLVFLLILVELGFAAFIYFDKSWEDDIPTDKTGDFDMIYDFLEENWKIVRWVALGIVVLEALTFVLALVVRAFNRNPEYDSDEEFIVPRQQIRQPLIGRPPPAPGVPVAGTLDPRPSRNDAWSTRLREKYGLDTAEFTYNLAESGRYQPVAPQPAEEKGCCIIM